MSARGRAIWPLAIVALVSIVGNVALLWALASTENGDYVEYRPVNFDRPRPGLQQSAFPYRIEDDSGSGAHREKVRFVLDRLGVEYRSEEPSIGSEVLLVARDAWEDKGLMAIVTNRARDIEWLRAEGYQGDASATNRFERGERDIGEAIEEYWKAISEGRRPRLG